jgi:hypothetical protein
MSVKFNNPISKPFTNLFTSGNVQKERDLLLIEVARGAFLSRMGK